MTVKDIESHRVAVDKCETALVEMTDLYYLYATTDREAANYAGKAEDRIIELIEYLNELINKEERS
tara:strand:- start:598 stop:795 length:198 start_codon:yes stop_codon:yes gene_type:complete